MPVPTIAILGGGPSGLSLARLLEVNGIDYIVYERDASPEVEIQGGSLDIHGKSGQLVLKEAGLFEEFKKYARWEDSKTIVQDKTGATLLNHAVSSVEKNTTGEVVVNFKNGDSATGFKLVVGADGAWSKARHLLTQAKPQYSGKHYLEAKISNSNPFHPTLAALVGRGNLIAMGDEKQVSAQRQGDGSYRVYLGVTVAEDFATNGPVDLAEGDGEAARGFFVTNADFFGTWGSSLKDIITYSEGAFRAWPLYHMPSFALSWASVPGVTVIGDAAHVSTPLVGEGVNCAMYDALVLSSQIVERGLDRLDAAVAAYEKEMFNFI
ncbi:FAD/NAD(P)-binding domain-containing protein [Trichoderma longibrachiatum ATCC 18648]|uniref:FAD/NAD(P)-binding domain-containing protein n=1 Tax=Trichoderma longibrachiatum ATCC 18648 TaxID=983965 RepID=A0A2T4C0N4_TRILO|nr:FAD/NAD(P)-binding domain-containing protein [Trichoderma longibrachiatum ATCC 18648]